MTTENFDTINAALFLGNPGDEYKYTRHNAGRMLAYKFTSAYQNKFKGLFSNFTISTENENKQIYFLLPETYMNLSGEAAQALLSFYKIEPSNLIVVHDEIELPLGSAALKYGGGLSGHNGLRSIKACLGTADFWRLRIGVGRPPHNDIAGWALSPFAKSELELFDAVLENCKTIFQNAILGVPKECKIVLAAD